MPIEVHSATEKDIPRLSLIEKLAFTGSKYNAVLFPGPFPVDPVKGRGDQLAKTIQDSTTARLFKAVDTTPEGDEIIVAWALWHVYIPSMTPLPPRPFPPGFNVEACMALFTGLDEMRVRLIADKPHIYLNTLVTDPKYQRQGVGKLLMKWGMEEAAKLKVPVFLISSRQGHRLYESLGFEDVEEFVLDFTKWGITDPHSSWAMIKN